MWHAFFFFWLCLNLFNVIFCFWDHKHTLQTPSFAFASQYCLSASSSIDSILCSSPASRSSSFLSPLVLFLIHFLTLLIHFKFIYIYAEVRVLIFMHVMATKCKWLRKVSLNCVLDFRNNLHGSFFAQEWHLSHPCFHLMQVMATKCKWLRKVSLNCVLDFHNNLCGPFFAQEQHLSHPCLHLHASDSYQM